VQEERMATPSTRTTTALMEGWLTKEGGTIKSWKKRWCVFADGQITYYTAPPSKVPSPPSLSLLSSFSFFIFIYLFFCSTNEHFSFSFLF
jgi:hypothetical protein